TVMEPSDAQRRTPPSPPDSTIGQYGDSNGAVRCSAANSAQPARQHHRSVRRQQWSRQMLSGELRPARPTAPSVSTATVMEPSDAQRRTPPSRPDSTIGQYGDSNGAVRCSAANSAQPARQHHRSVRRQQWSRQMLSSELRPARPTAPSVSTATAMEPSDAQRRTPPSPPDSAIGQYGDSNGAVRCSAA